MKKRVNNEKLRIRRETLRKLDPAEVRLAAGAVTHGSGTTCMNGTCGGCTTYMTSCGCGTCEECI